MSRTPTSWDPEDDILLMHLKDQQKLGWKAIASHFQNRTPNACQFRWRRLKSGNLKNPPKSASSLGPAATVTESFKSVDNNPSDQGHKKQKKYAFPNTKAGHHHGTGFPSAYTPIPASSFPVYDNNVGNALAGLNALSNNTSTMSSPMPISNNSPVSNTEGHNSPAVPPQTTNNYEHSPNSELSLDPTHHGGVPTDGGGYYADISVDPTMNLPHHQPHPHPSSGITPRNSTSGPSSTSSGSGIGASSSGTPTIQHNNSIIQIVKGGDDRNSISSARDSISSLPSKSMNIPHHQQNSTALAHLPIIFGSNGSISGPSRNSSISHSTTVPSLRNGSIVGASSGYFSRSGSVVIPLSEKKDELKAIRKLDKHRKAANKDAKRKKGVKEQVLKLPWSMEEDELLINRRNRELSFAELSILLPQRTEGEIWARIDYLEKLRNGSRSSVARERRRRQSSIGLDDVEDFYMSDIGVVTEDDDDDEVLLEVEDIPQAHRRGLKRRASSAVNPLTVNH
ncbi:hypothetical protein PSN45_003291 [Yamadazyma tenuis]|uniref:Myb-like domain-containing protein n=2 Tax=Candida tenuis (strain ATCC 10573 / BCRC 21748 / CBS 615 / JCM 9827 / NBRC 10315 / NRRL Y-1498 / VKM Y-70) TaxID=590646 RepID=G3AYQ5_CANTC|nr:uncharacterized protein CANTEDRAFT_112781 [Yamadazyma tenuis ATCC 10573]EGV66237.1 hypothetical protein CANTEDRAFT_112781 [Yamadazyma tenuis ATCC 10573]WEJ95764.1 hypothetical protein PSN45_003291 [Yamadazyma tenuis]